MSDRRANAQLQRALRQIAQAIAMLEVRMAVLEEMTVPPKLQEHYRQMVEREIGRRKADRQRREDERASEFKRQMTAMFLFGDEIDPRR